MSVLSLSCWESDVYWRQSIKHFSELATQNSRKQLIWRNYVTVTLCIWWCTARADKSSEVHIDVRSSEVCRRRCFWRWRELSFQTSTLACTPSLRLFHTPFTSPPLTTQLNCQFSWVQFGNCSQLQFCSVHFSCRTYVIIIELN